MTREERRRKRRRTVLTAVLAVGLVLLCLLVTQCGTYPEMAGATTVAVSIG